MFQKTRPKRGWAVMVLMILGLLLGKPDLARCDETALRIGLARAKITPSEPIWMAGYASRDKPSEGVLTDLYAKAMIRHLFSQASIEVGGELLADLVVALVLGDELAVVVGQTLHFSRELLVDGLLTGLRRLLRPPLKPLQPDAQTLLEELLCRRFDGLGATVTIR